MSVARRKLRIEGWKAYIISVIPLVAAALLGLITSIHQSANTVLGLGGAFTAGTSMGLLIGGFFTFYDEIKVPRIRLGQRSAKRAQGQGTKPRPGFDSIIYGFMGPQLWIYKIFGEMDDVLRKSWLGFTPEEYSALMVFYSLLASIITAVAAYFVVKLLYAVPLGFIAAFLASIMTMKAYPSFRKSELADSINLRLPYVIVEMAALSASGLTAEKVLESIAEGEQSKGIKLVFSFVVRNIKFFGQDIATALSEGIKRSPSSELSEFMLAFQSTVLSGADVNRFLSDYARKIMVDKRIALRYMVERLNVLIEAFTTGFIVLPTTLIIMALLMSFVSSTGIALYFLFTTYALVPLFGVMFIFMAEAVSPR